MSLMHSIQDFLSSFDRLPQAEKLAVAKEIGKRIKELGDLEGGPLDSDELTYLTDQLFLMYEAEEQSNGSDGTPPW